MIRRIALAAVAIAAVTATADEVHLTNGSRLIGAVKTIHDGKLTIDTDFAGTLTIDQEKVAAIATDTPRNVALKSGNTLRGPLRRAEDRTTVATANGTLDISDDTITALWAEDAESPALRALRAESAGKDRKWAYQAGAGLIGKTGNTESVSANGKFTATLKSDRDKLLFYASGARGEQNGALVANEVKGGIDYEYVSRKNHSWYVREELEYDEVEDLDLRSTTAVGYGYYFIRKPNHDLRGRAGLSLKHESFTVGDNETNAGLDVGLHHKYAFAGGSALTNDITYTPTFDDFGRYTIDHESTVDFKIAGHQNLTLSVGVNNQYNSEPVGDRDALDTTYFTRFGLTWE